MEDTQEGCGGDWIPQKSEVLGFDALVTLEVGQVKAVLRKMAVYVDILFKELLKDNRLYGIVESKYLMIVEELCRRNILNWQSMESVDSIDLDKSIRPGMCGRPT